MKKRYTLFIVMSLVIISVAPNSSFAMDDYYKDNIRNIDRCIEGIKNLTSIMQSKDDKYNISNPSESGLLQEIDGLVVSPKKFETVYRTSKAVLSGVENGVSYNNYSSLIQPFFAEISIVKDMADSNNERLLAEAYSDAAEIYSSVGILWSAVIAAGQDSTKDLIPSAFFEARQILEKANEAYLRNYHNKGRSIKSPRKVR
jgi:hypothetical protein